MDSETIYEALGEVVPVEKKNGCKVSIDEGFGAHPDEENLSSMQQPLFGHEMTDEAVAECIFNCCDIEKTGSVRVSVLVDFLLKYASENSEIRETFQQVLIALDPNETNPEVTIEIFQSALKFCINQLTSKTEDTEWLLDFSSLKLQSTQHSITSTNNNVIPCNSTSSELLCGMMDIKELQFQFNRLQEENALLQEQMADVEETNVSLRSENSQLKCKINKVELTASEIGQHSQILQENNGQLQSRVTQMKDELQKMTVHYDECRRELEKKVRELESFQVNRMKGEEHCQHLVDTIKHLEEIILVKEEELKEKDKEIQRISQDLMEQQLLSDPVVVNEFGSRQGSEVVENLAAELQSSYGDTPWKKQMMGSVLKPDFIHPAAWNVMLNEPEYEDEPVCITTSLSNSEDTSSAVEHNRVVRKAEQIHNQITRNSYESLSTQISQSQLLDMVHSTPISKTAPVSRFCNEEQAVTKSSNVVGFFTIPKHSLKVLFLFTVLLTVVFAIASVAALLLLLSMSSTSGCSGISNYHQQASPFYSSSLLSKVFEIIKPYCSIEYHGCPPV